jgi:hypothetical protein
MWGALFSFLGGPVIKGLIDAYKTRLQNATQQDSLAADLAAKEILGEIAQRQTEAALIRQEQGWWPTAIIRPLFAAPFIVFTCKVVVWDKVLGLGTTDALAPNMRGAFQAVIYAYFVSVRPTPPSGSLSRVRALLIDWQIKEQSWTTGGDGQPAGFQFQGSSSRMRLIGWSAMRASTSRR